MGKVVAMLLVLIIGCATNEERSVTVGEAANIWFQAECEMRNRCQPEHVEVEHCVIFYYNSVCDETDCGEEFKGDIAAVEECAEKMRAYVCGEELQFGEECKRP